MAKKKVERVVEERPVLYPELTVNGQVIPDDVQILTAQTAKDLLVWENEPDYTARLMAENDTLLPEQCLFGDEFILKDLDGHKVRCWNNLGNRNLKESGYKKYAQDILTRRWAGTTGRDGETTNGETIIIGRTGRVISGQHRLIALIIACQMWESDRKRWVKFWDEEPYIKSLVVFGADESPLTTRTIDNVIARTETDVIHTSGIFDNLTVKGKPASTYDKREHARMLAAATDLVWERTRAAGDTTTESDYDDANRYQTHGASMDFIERHERLIKCVKHAFTEDMDRVLSNSGLNSGQCAGLLFLMASSATDGQRYRGPASAASERSERKMDWTREEAARDFLTKLAKKDASFAAIFGAKRPRVGDASPDDYNGGVFGSGESSGTRDERMAVLAKAWNLLMVGEKLTVNRLRLAYDTPQSDDPVLGVSRGPVIDVIQHEFTAVGGADLGPRRKVPAAVKPGESNGDQPDEIVRRTHEEQAAKLRALRESKGKPATRLPDEVDIADRGTTTFKIVKPKNRRADPNGPPTDEPAVQEEALEEEQYEEAPEEVPEVPEEAEEETEVAYDENGELIEPPDVIVPEETGTEEVNGAPEGYESPFALIDSVAPPDGAPSDYTPEDELTNDEDAEETAQSEEPAIETPAPVAKRARKAAAPKAPKASEGPKMTSRGVR